MTLPAPASPRDRAETEPIPIGTATLPSAPEKPGPLRRALPAIFVTSKALISLVGHVPRPVGHAIAAAVSIPVRRITWNRCRNNLESFFGPLGVPAAERERIHHAHQKYMVRLRLEAARVLAGPAHEIERVTEFVGAEHLDRALSAGRGALLVGGHEGTWWHAPAYLAGRGVPLRAVFNSFPLKRIDDYLVRRARARGIRLSMIDQGAAEEFRSCSRDNEVFYLTFDLAVRPQSAALFPFGPMRLPVERGPAILALRLGMPIILVESIHLPRGRSLIRLLPPLDVSSLGPHRVDALCRLWTERLEARVLARPEQWWPWGFAEFATKRG